MSLPTCCASFYNSSCQLRQEAELVFAKQPAQLAQQQKNARLVVRLPLAANHTARRPIVPLQTQYTHTAFALLPLPSHTNSSCQAAPAAEAYNWQFSAQGWLFPAPALPDLPSPDQIPTFTGLFPTSRTPPCLHHPGPLPSPPPPLAARPGSGHACSVALSCRRCLGVRPGWSIAWCGSRGAAAPGSPATGSMGGEERRRHC